MSDDPEIQRAVRRTVGIAALHRIRRIVDADNALEAFISRLRKKLAPSGASIRTLRGLGYLMEEARP